MPHIFPTQWQNKLVKPDSMVRKQSCFFEATHQNIQRTRVTSYRNLQQRTQHTLSILLKCTSYTKSMSQVQWTNVALFSPQESRPGQHWKFVIPVWGEAIEILINIAVKILLNCILIEVAVNMVILLGLHFQYSIFTSLYILVVL